MPHIHTKPGQHDATVSAYIVRYVDDEPHLLLHRHKKVRKVMQPGGHVELTETPWQAVLHEIPEETGFELSQLRVLQPSAPPFVTAEHTIVMPVPFLKNSHRIDGETITHHYHDDDVFVFLANGSAAKQPDADESQELYWLNKQQIYEWDEADVAFGVKEVAISMFDNCLPQWQPYEIDTFRQHA